MDETLTLEGTPDAAELKTAINRCLAKIDEVREGMQHRDASIEAARKETLANLADIADVLADLKAA